MAKKPTSAPGSNPDGELAQAVDRLTDVLSTVYDLLARFKEDLTWVINNRGEFSRHPSPPPGVGPAADAEPGAGKNPEAIACTDCDAASPESLSAALHAGWTELTPSEGKTWNFLGLCPDCLRNEYSPRPVPAQDDAEPEPPPGADPAQPQSTLFD